MTSHFHLPSEQLHLTSTPQGERLEATKTNFPALEGMAFYKLRLDPRAIREPHWHANAHELGYCLEGELRVSLYTSGNLTSAFIVNKGETFYIPSGSLHAIENVSENPSQVIFQFSHENPSNFSLTSTFGMFSDAVLGNTWGAEEKTFHSLKRSLEPVFIAKKKQSAQIPKSAYYPSPYHFNLEQSPSPISNEGGCVKVARKSSWPVLKEQSLYSLHLSSQGMREPHWHPETAEMGYVNVGKARISIQSPNGTVETFELKEGDIYFIPKAYPHHIENMRADVLHLLIFFDQAAPQDIGFSASVKSFDNDLLSACFNCEETFFPSLHTYYSDLLIVKRINPLD